MPRAVSIRHTVVPSAERGEFRTRASQSRDRYKALGCRYWLYEEKDLPGAYVEFFESPDAAALEKAHQEMGANASRIYVEVELN